jgi:hypothetical protein
MMFNQKLVASIKVNGKILREFKDTVYLPFGAEYSLLVKNLNTVRVLFNVYIDGENHTPEGFVLYPGQEVDLERSIKNGSLTEGNKFKFIERSGAVEQHRGIKLEDGLVRIEYQFEKVQPLRHTYRSVCSSPDPWGDPAWGDLYNKAEYDKIVRSTTNTANYSCNNITTMNVGGAMPPPVATSCSYTDSAGNASTMSISRTTAQAFVNDAGITVPGSHSSQQFATASWFATEAEKHSIVLKLLGETEDNRPIEKPITVKHKPRCVTCNKQNKANAKFCAHCGTALVIYA